MIDVGNMQSMREMTFSSNHLNIESFKRALVSIKHQINLIILFPNTCISSNDWKRTNSSMCQYMN